MKHFLVFIFLLLATSGNCQTSDSDLNRLNEKIYRKIYDAAKDLVKTGEEISREYGIPIVNKRISVTPIALVGGAACRTIEDFASIAKTLDKVAHEVGVNFIGGYSALVCKGMTPADDRSGLYPRKN